VWCVHGHHRHEYEATAASVYFTRVKFFTGAGSETSETPVVWATQHRHGQQARVSGDRHTNEQTNGRTSPSRKAPLLWRGLKIKICVLVINVVVSKVDVDCIANTPLMRCPFRTSALISAG